MIILYLLCSLLIMDYIADYKLQSRDMALKKSEDLKVLFKHMLIIFGGLFVGCFPIIGLNLLFGKAIFSKVLMFCSSYTLIHGAQDWVIWRGYKHSILKRHLEKARQFVSDPKTINIEQIKASLVNFKYYEDKLFYDTIGLDSRLHTLAIILLFGVFFL